MAILASASLKTRDAAAAPVIVVHRTFMIIAWKIEWYYNIENSISKSASVDAMQCIAI